VNIQELATRCAAAVTNSTQLDLPNEDAHVFLVLPKRWKAPLRFPRGKTVQWNPDGSRVAYFSAMNVLAWLAANGLVEVGTNVSK
jgi:hypothetical protein